MHIYSLSILIVLIKDSPIGQVSGLLVMKFNNIEQVGFRYTIENTEQGKVGIVKIRWGNEIFAPGNKGLVANLFRYSKDKKVLEPDNCNEISIHAEYNFIDTLLSKCISHQYSNLCSVFFRNRKYQ